MPDCLQGKKIAFLTGEVQAFNHLDKGETFEVDRAWARSMRANTTDEEVHVDRALSPVVNPMTWERRSSRSSQRESTEPERRLQCRRAE
jgi:hypothetical protein